MLGEESRERPIERFRRGAAGAVVVAALLGLREALEAPRDDDPVVGDWTGDPPGRDRILLRLDPDEPADSIVWIRAPARETSR